MGNFCSFPKLDKTEYLGVDHRVAILEDGLLQLSEYAIRYKVGDASAWKHSNMVGSSNAGNNLTSLCLRIWLPADFAYFPEASLLDCLPPALALQGPFRAALQGSGRVSSLMSECKYKQIAD